MYADEHADTASIADNSSASADSVADGDESGIYAARLVDDSQKILLAELILQQQQQEWV